MSNYEGTILPKAKSIIMLIESYVAKAFPPVMERHFGRCISFLTYYGRVSQAQFRSSKKRNRTGPGDIRKECCGRFDQHCGD
jgi:hypothetical protein